jgi:hypothetical protein
MERRRRKSREREREKEIRISECHPDCKITYHIGGGESRDPPGVKDHYQKIVQNA